MCSRKFANLTALAASCAKQGIVAVEIFPAVVRGYYDSSTIPTTVIMGDMPVEKARTRL
jgi:hypothetical protein